MPGLAHSGEPGRVDHHVHVHSPAMLEFLPLYCESLGRISACPEVFVSPPPLEALIAQMQVAGVDRAHVMSSGYLAQSSMMVPAPVDADALVRESNRFTVDLARSSQGRFSAFISLNPINRSALDEIAYWSGQDGVTGLKLHLTNSGVDLRHSDHVAALAEIFGAADQAGLMLTVHMRTRAADYGAQDVQIFLEQVRVRAPNSPVILAHSGGWGGLDSVTWDALEALASAREAGHPGTQNMYFELGQVFKADTSVEDLERLVQLMRRIGLERFLPGSDWPFSGDLDDYLNRVYGRLPLTPAEAHLLRYNQLTWPHYP